jgi:hypothetical protein
MVVRMTEETTYTLYRGAVFVLSGSRDTINLYLRICLDKWEESLIGDKRNAWFLCSDREAKEGILSIIRQDKYNAYSAWVMDMREGEWKVKWTTEDGMQFREYINDADKFFLEGVKE